MSYLPLARKYRPQAFDELIGQPHVTTTLARAIETRHIGQAYLFTGQRGVGKTSAARILAKSLNCAKGPTAQPCQKCPSCLAINQGSSLDVLEIDGASNRGIDEVRSLRETVKFSPTQGTYRIYIIDEVHMLTPEAFNALLKTLEEPPAHVKFIFATTSPQKLPQTILSRCQRFDFRRLDANTTVSALKRLARSEKITIEDGALYAIARASEGSLRDAEVVLEQLASFCDGPICEEDVGQLLGTIEQDALLAWSQALFDGDAKTALLLLAEQLDRGKEIAQLLMGLVLHLRNLLVLRTTSGAPDREGLLRQLIDVPDERLTQLDEQAKHANPEELLFMVQVLTGAYELARRSPFAQAILEFALIKLATRESWASLDEVLRRLNQLAQAPSASASVPAGASKTIGKPAPRPELPVGQARPQVVSAPSPTTMPSASREPSRATGSSVAAAVVETVDGVVLEELLVLWPKVRERIGQQRMSLAAYLSDSRPLSVTEQGIQVGLPAFSLHHEVLSRAENLRLVAQALQEVVGRPLSVEYVTLPAPIPGAASEPHASKSLEDVSEPSETSASPIVEHIVEMFNATILPSPKPTS